MRENPRLRCQRGFTLIELLITLAVSGILMAGVYTAFKSQQDSYLAQDQVAEMQQNIRAGLDVMTRDIRMAGYDPALTGNYGIVTAAADRFVFSLDDPDNPGVELELSYDLFLSVGVSSLGRSTDGDPRSAIAEGIENLEFRYLDANGETTVDTSAIRSVQVSILARARFPDRNYTNTITYPTASSAEWGPFDDNFRRRFQIMTVNLRNMGL